MSKKTIRIILASTVLIPVWLLIGLAVFIFPGCITMFMGPAVAGWNLLKLLVAELDEGERQECRQEIKDGLIMAVAPVIAMLSCCSQFIETGKIEFE